MKNISHTINTTHTISTTNVEGRLMLDRNDVVLMLRKEASLTRKLKQMPNAEIVALTFDILAERLESLRAI